MDADREDAQGGLWWLIEHPEGYRYWTGCGWAAIADHRVMNFTTEGEAQWEVDHRPVIGHVKITQHGPAIFDPSNRYSAEVE